MEPKPILLTVELLDRIRDAKESAIDTSLSSADSRDVGRLADAIENLCDVLLKGAS